MFLAPVDHFPEDASADSPQRENAREFVVLLEVEIVVHLFEGAREEQYVEVHWNVVVVRSLAHHLARRSGVVDVRSAHSRI